MLQIKKISWLITAGVIILISAGIAWQALPWFQEQMFLKQISKVTPELNYLLENIINITNKTGVFPVADSLDLNLISHESNNNTYLYNLKFWSSVPEKVQRNIMQTAYLQGYLNGKALRLTPGTGGLVTCLLVNNNDTINSTCYYQIKDM